MFSLQDDYSTYKVNTSAVEIWTPADEARVVNVGYKRKPQFP